MTTKIGPTFSDELKAAGLHGLPFVWYDNGTYNTDQLTPAQQATFQQVLASHNPGTPTVPMVSAERDRRLALGFTYTFSDSRGAQRIGTTPADMAGWDEVSKLAAAFIAVGTPTAPIYIATNTGAITVTALEWQQIILASAQFRQPIWQASFVLESSSPIPADYTADYHWPPVT